MKNKPYRRRGSYLERSVCCDIIVRGTAHQIADKYDTLAVDAGRSGDIILEQLYYNHAEHWRKKTT